ncbi:hypothetical protein EG329_011982 [Mollisiaceae sp. DMI_Dod_QoI]|nr:hypothetical protein EG329_011982 [Helotiales sp. DMI_Dod_QoI]
MSPNFNLLLDPKGDDPLRSFRARPYTWDRKQASDSEAFRDKMHQRYRFPTTKPKTPNPVLPHSLDHVTTAAEIGFDPEPAPKGMRGPLTWQAETLKWLFIFLGLLSLLVTVLLLSSIFGGVVKLVSIVLTTWWCVEKARLFLNSDEEFEVES